MCNTGLEMERSRAARPQPCAVGRHVITGLHWSRESDPGCPHNYNQLQTAVIILKQSKV